MANDHRTEAACLVELGASYRSRIGLEPVEAGGDPIFAGFKREAFSIYFGDAPIYHFDLDGRWQRAFVEGTHYLKGLDATVHAIDRVREGANLVLKRRTLGDVEASVLDANVRAMVRELIADIDAGRFRRREPPTGKARPLSWYGLIEFLEKIRSWDAARWFAHRVRYLVTYDPLPFLPPECQNAVVLQATLGHRGGRSFGLLSTAEPLTRSSRGFERHAREVMRLWGLRLLQSRVIFLAGSDVLRKPVERVVAYLDAVGRTFPIEPKVPGSKPDRVDDEDIIPRFDGVHAFLDNFSSPRPDRAAWGEFATRGLARVSLGVESGDPAVRALYDKSWTDDDLVATVADVKSAGLGVSLLTLVGAGGVERAESHVRFTTQLIDMLDLGAGDFVFLLDENEVRDPNRSLEGLTLLQGPAWSEQQAKLKEALAPLKKKGVKVLPYTMEKQWT
jgi:hypothetical protein